MKAKEKQLLEYLKKTDIERYRALIAKLNLRKSLSQNSAALRARAAVWRHAAGENPPCAFLLTAAFCGKAAQKMGRVWRCYPLKIPNRLIQGVFI